MVFFRIQVMEGEARNIPAEVLPYKTSLQFSFLVLQVLLFFLLSSSCYAISNADKKEDAEYLTLDLEDLVKVSIASKREEKIQDAPGIIEVITKEKIRTFGANTLTDLLMRLPNVYYASAGNVQDTNINIRAVSSGAINKQLLIMWNGRPLRDPKAGGINSLIYKSFPLETLERIELIRGPGSVLYGTSAFAGVVNLITKDEKNRTPYSTIALKTGSKGMRAASFSAGGAYNAFSYHVAAQFDQADGLGGFFDEDGVYSDQSMESEGKLATGKLFYDKFSFSFLLGRESTLTPRFRVRFPFRTRDRERSMFDVGYKHQFSNQRGELVANVMHSTQKSYDNDVDLVDPSRSLQAEISYKNSYNDERTHLLIGLIAEKLRGQHNITSEYIQQTWRNLYTQVDFKASDKLKLIFGLQANDPKTTEIDYSPRIGAIYTINNNYSLKVLYSEAFRSPTVFERGLRTRTSPIADEDLGPETIATTDVQLNYQASDVTASLTFYKSLQEDAIRFRVNPDNPTTNKFQNFGETKFRGVELEGQYIANDYWVYEGSVTYQHNEEFGVEDVQLAPNFMAKLGVAYNNQKGLRVGLFNHYFGEPTPAENISSSTPIVNPKSDAYNHLTLNVSVQLGHYFDLPRALSGSTFSIFGNNLLRSKKTFSPDINRSINTFPIHHARSVYAKLTLQF